MYLFTHLFIYLSVLKASSLFFQVTFRFTKLICPTTFPSFPYLTQNHCAISVLFIGQHVTPVVTRYFSTPFPGRQRA